jgi:hypothetical protein
MGDKPDYVNGEPKPVLNSGPSMHVLVADDLLVRKQYGLNKYNSLLQAYNGRNFLQDIYEEMQDGIVYLKGALEEQDTAVRFFKFILEKWVNMHDQTYPERAQDVILYTKGRVPGWLYQVTKDVLGDRYEHSFSDDDRLSEGSQ